MEIIIFHKYIMLSYSAGGPYKPDQPPRSKTFSHTASYKPPKKMKSLTIFLFSLLVLIATTAADEITKRKRLIECANKELDKENAGWKLQGDELEKLKKIIDDEVLKEPLKSHTAEEQAKVLKEIEDAGKKDLPKVSVKQLDKIMAKLKEHSMHCAKEMRS
ncbi:hypothetical protein F9C07_2234720 [Aspergillus flavus]|uniref:Uncharacterized protein n=7 Tax=Aspergillus subgen. Circumdati TaxID=2720871 RepID=A0A7U2MJB7_ASPFN|nr:unnamed protein product [Aspergillus oryzae RIB40]XP_041148205.1 uncharacterized protein G4B84_008633 [Aspergillus flavus NRRL3357]EIT82206.1 hypothetical protein Ao3042_00639 [Aspergillus oryzae 3.042]KAB8242020.1 hypothetical protein BDV35DRAFT_43714 [Aspergillus flavus]KDE85783.1 hypothetical protein AO1008_01390 [Aspergillus oryzae 100-8]KAF7616084.1 hypothetical protein AFLA_009586 [Aspergillus flavus NRRL3357]KAJ1711618.1 hypothetical protein NYO67_6238 [Aspergillus flavus]|eukprot:EIT82206.1 hypothetical protein Ao3042_00639 [Aspergillus oryzae 3.042]